MHHGSTLGTVPLGLALLSSNVEEERSAERSANRSPEIRRCVRKTQSQRYGSG